MKPINIKSAYQGVFASCKIDTDKKVLFKYLNISMNDAQSLSKFVNLLENHDADSTCFNGYFAGYSIQQISKEFDLLRFSDNLIINIELKGVLDDSTKQQKITRQMLQNYYYLKFLNKEILIFTYVEDDGLYMLNLEAEKAQKTNVTELIAYLSQNKVNYDMHPDNLFVPSNYLISPFNNTEKFINQEFFLTDHQQRIKNEILRCLNKNEFRVFCISANAGTGKTLLTYEIARSLTNSKNAVLIIHTGKLNSGHEALQKYGWNISSINRVKKDMITTLINSDTSLVVVDEAQRIEESQLDLIIERAAELEIPILFSYDTKQFLRNNETKDIFEYVSLKYPKLSITKYTLTDRIRTNKELSSFIKNLFEIGNSRSDLGYETITIEYFDSLDGVKEYIKFLEENEEWKAITFTASMYSKESIDSLLSVCETNAHDVIGQEFKKVVWVMDSNFRYNEGGKLETTRNYYSVFGMLYQIATRVVDELKIIVLGNPELFFKLLEIKHNKN